jgi:hypothetical protein
MAAATPPLLAANAAFYRAFAAGDLPAMAALWSERQPVACVHPGWPALSGRAIVMESWQMILRTPPALSFTDAEACDWGAAGLVLCRERVAGTTLVASNLFVLEDDAWRMVHHQATPLGARSDDPPEPSSRLN